MKVTKICPAATIVMQFPANVEIEVVNHEGKTYLPMFSVEDDGEEVEEKPAKKKEPVFEEKPAPAKKAIREFTSNEEDDDEEEKPVPAKKSGLTENELIELPVKDLLVMCEEMGIDPDKTEGKNTNKKLRILILNASAKGTKEAPAKQDEEEDEVYDAVATALEDFDKGVRNKAKTVEVICTALGTDDDEVVAAFVTKFEKDEDADLDEIAAQIIAEVNGEAAPKEGKKEAKGKRELVEAEDLEVGDKVAVYWAGEFNEEYKGVVESKKRGKVTILYEDNEREPINAEVHTKIYRL